MQNKLAKKRLLLIGATKGSTHIRNYYNLVSDYFDEILIVTNDSIDFCQFEIVDFSLRNPIKLFKSIARLRKIIERFDPTLIHVHQANSISYITIKANQKKYPVVMTAWGSDVLILPQKGGLYRYMVKYALKGADVITVDARFMASEIQKLGIKNKAVLANFGIEYDQMILPSKENIIYSNRLHNDIYNIDKIIVGFADFLKEFPNWKLVIGANGKNTSELKSLANKILPKESYEFIGFVDKEENKRQYLRARLWVSIPSSDGTAISLLEAMGYGCVPVVSNLPANLEWISDGENGFVVKNDITEAFKSALNLELIKVQELNSKIIEERATKKSNKLIYEKIYDEVILRQRKTNSDL